MPVQEPDPEPPEPEPERPSEPVVEPGPGFVQPIVEPGEVPAEVPPVPAEGERGRGWEDRRPGVPGDGGRGSEGGRTVGGASRVLEAVPAQAVPPGVKGLRLNFRGVPLEQVLNYLSDAAGFIINLETEVSGKVDVWSNQPLDREEALELLTTVLARHGYAAIRKDRMLTIVSRDEAKKRTIPVVSGNIPDNIPQSEEIVTQIIPVRYISATQLVKDLQQLLPSTATLTANEGGNALVLTDAQANIRRMAEIVQALDTAVASVSSVQVFPLMYADAKTLATTIQNLFQSQDTSRGNQGGAARFFNAFRGGPPGMGGGGGGESASAGGGRAPTPKVVAVADERSNSVVVSAPEEQMVVIEGVIKQIDQDVDEITELRVFHLQHADPQEMADVLSSLFSDTGSTQNQRGGQFRFAGGPFGMMGGGRGGGDQSTRAQQQNRVVAVADPRTGSGVVSAAKGLMEQIAAMITQLDADPARKQKVYVYSVENTDPEALQEILQNLFPEQQNSSMRNRTSNTQRNSNQLNNRTTQNNNSQRSRNTGLGTGSALGSGFGNTGR